MSNIDKNGDTVLPVELLDLEREYSLHQLCEICHITETEVFRFMEYNVIELDNSNEMMFRQIHLDKLLTGIRLQRDLELNHAGIALALDLLDTIDQLKREIALLRIPNADIQ